MERTYKVLEHAIDSLISIVEARDIESMSKHLASVSLAMELRTVAVNPGRRMGKSTYIKDSLRPGRDICLVGSEYAKKVCFGSNSAVFATQGNNLRHWLYGRQLERVYIDEPTVVFNAMPLLQVYMDCINRGAQTFILIGA